MLEVQKQIGGNFLVSDLGTPTRSSFSPYSVVYNQMGQILNQDDFIGRRYFRLLA